jgi:hypothetical protein
MSGEAESTYGPRRAPYDLKKLRDKKMLAGSETLDAMSQSRTAFVP